MRQALRILTMCGVWLLGCASLIQAQNAGPRAQDSEGLYSDDEQELMGYLADHTIPFYDNQGAGNAPPVTDPMFQDQVKRALEVFKTGSPRLRLAIAKSLFWAPNSETVGFWKACGPDDAEAQHYLFGVVFANAPDDMKTALRRWLLEEADLKYAPALLKNLYGRSLFANTDAPEQEKILAFLERLYKQQGVVVRHKGPDEETTISGSVQEYVVRLLPRAERGWELLLEWMAADATTADDGTLRAMWGQWQMMSQADVTRHPEIVELCETTAHSTALAQSWCLSPRKVSFPSRFPELKNAFERNVWSQVFSDDERVRRGIITSRLQGGGRWNKTRTPEFLRSVEATAQARTRAAAEARDIYDRLTELDEYTEGQRTRTWLDKRLEAVNAALLPR